MPFIDAPPLWLPPEPAIVRPAPKRLLRQAIIPGMMPGPGFFAPPVGAADIESTYQDGGVDGAEASTHTISSLTFTAKTGGYALVGVVTPDDNPSISSVTLDTGDGSGATSGTELLDISGGTRGTAGFYLWERGFGSTSSGEVVVNWGSTAGRAMVFVWHLANMAGGKTAADATASDDTHSSGEFSAAVTVAAGGAAFAVAGNNGSSPPTIDWTGGDLVEADELSVNTRTAGAANLDSAPGGSLTASAAFSQSADGVLGVVGFRG